jgi:hypothetical protein
MKNDFDFYQFVLQKHKFRLDSTKDFYFVLTTDNNDSILFTSDGRIELVGSSTFHEVLGRKLPPYGRIPAKVIQAENGDIILTARHGKIILQASSIIIDGVDALSGEVVINASSNIQLNAPTANMQTDNTSIVAANSFSAAGGAFEGHGEVATEQTVGTDFFKASFFGKILSAIQKFKKFFESSCGD